MNKQHVLQGVSPLKHAPHIKFVDAVWATAGRKAAGVVLLFDTITNEYKAYWGGVDGIDEWEDICWLSNHGNKVPNTRLNMWFNMDELPANPFEKEN